MSEPVINYRRPYGEITPFLHTAAFEQDGNFFDVQGRYLEKDKNGMPIARPDADEEVDPADPDAAWLFTNVEKVSWNFFSRHARRLLKEAGIEEFTPSKEGFLEALKKIKIDQAGARPEPEISKSAIIDGEINLAAWARGDVDYLADKVYKAIRETYPGGRPTTVHDAVDFLIGEGVITADQARQV